MLLVAVLTLVMAVPQVDLLRSVPGGWPVSWLRSVLTLPAWADPLPRPALPAQSSGPAAPVGDAAAGDTRAYEGTGSGAGRGIGALEADDRKAAKAAAKAAPKTSPVTDKDRFDPATSKRIAAAASETSDVYANVDGSYTRKVSQDPINYRAADGSWQPIDTTVRRGAGGRYAAGANAFGADFAAQAGDSSLASVRTPAGHVVSYSLQGAASVAGVASGSSVTYPGVLPETDLVVTTESTGVKEELVLHTRGGTNSWVFPLHTQGLTPRLAATGSVELVSAAGVVEAVIPPGNMHDSKFDQTSGSFAESRAVSYELTTAEGVPALRITADAGWLNDPARVYPVTIDPSVWSEIRANASTYVMSGVTATNDFEYILPAGTYDGTTKARSFLKFDLFAPTYSGARVTSAMLQVFNVWAWHCTAHPVDVWAVGQSWDPATTRTWPGPALGYKVGSSSEAPGAACTNTSLNQGVGTWLHMPIDTNLLTWWAGSGPNDGLAILASESDKTHWRKFCSARCTNSPVLQLTYVPNQAPQVDSQYPGFGASSSTLTPQLLASASDPDAWPQALSYNFQVYDKDANKIAESGATSTPAWTVPAGKLRWGQSYSWTVAAWDGHSSSSSQTINLLSTSVPQPAVTSTLSQNGGKGFEPAAGNYTTAATDAQVATVGPPLAVQRSYNSLDPRTGSAFGVGWSSVVDVTASQASSGSGVADLVTIRYPAGQEIAFGVNPDGTFVPPQGRFATLSVVSGGGYRLVDKDGTAYVFTTAAGAGVWRVSSITDAAGRAEVFAYNAAGQLTSMTSASGRMLRLTWTASSGGHVATVVTDPVKPGDATSVLTWKYTYSGDQLTKVCAPTSATACTTYTYGDNSLFRSAVLNTGPRSYWRLADASGVAATSEVAVNEGTDNGTYTEVTRGVAGPLSGSSSLAAGFNGSTSRVELPAGLVSNASYQTVSLWFRTSTANGVLFSYQADPVSGATTAANYTPALYVGGDGKLYGQFWYSGQVNPMVTSAAVTDGAWHQVVLTAAGDTQSMYVDNALVGSRSGLIQMVSPAGSQHVYAGAGFLGGAWPNQAHTSTTSNTGYATFFTGSIADVVFGNQTMTAAAVSRVYTAGRTTARVLTGAEPVNLFETTWP